MTASNVLYLPACNSLRVNLTPCACAVHSLEGGEEQSWARVPGFAFRVPGVLGTRARGNAIFLKHAGTQNAKK